MPEVRLEKVSRHFGNVVAVNSIELSVAEGEFISFLGPSGCGKTTTLRMIAGLEHNTGGKIWIGDRLVSDGDQKSFVQPENRNAGMVFQSYAIWPHMTVLENVGYPLQIRRLPKSEITQRALRALGMVDMEKYANRPATALSGGQQQRVAIARAIAFEPSVLLLDEPLSNLDAKLREQMRVELRALQKKLGITAIYVTHDQEEAMSLSDQIVVMRAGEILQISDPETIYFRPANAHVADFCGSPNMLSGQVVEVERSADNLFRVKVSGNGWAGWGLASSAFAPSTDVKFVVRPEAVRILDDSRSVGAGATLFNGTVAQSIFRGFRRSVILEAQFGNLLFDTSTERRTRVGDNLKVAIDESRVWVVAS